MESILRFTLYYGIISLLGIIPPTVWNYTLYLLGYYTTYMVWNLTISRHLIRT